MSRTGLHRPRRYRAVCHRPATGTRLLPTPHSRLDHSLGWGIPLALSKIRHGGSGGEACPEPRRRGSQERNGRGLLFSPTHLNPHYKRCPKGPTPPPSQRSITVPPPAWKVPGQITAHPLQGLLPSARPTHPAHPFRLLQATPRSAASCRSPRAIAPPWAFAPFSGLRRR